MDVYGYVVVFGLLWFGAICVMGLFMTLHQLWPTLAAALADKVERLHQRLQARRFRRELEKWKVL